MILKKLLETNSPLIVPDAYDAVSARLIEEAGFPAVQCSGYSMSIAMGALREDNLSLSRNLQVTKDICESVGIPVMADGEDGYGPPKTVRTTVEAFIDAGVEGINLEDQLLREVSPGIIDMSLMEEKLKAARAAAEKCGCSDFVINGRTDALAVSSDREEGLEDALMRGKRYLEAGADMVFVTQVTTIEEAKRIVDELPGKVSIAAGLPYNRTKLPLPELIAIGPARISLPTVAILSAMQGIKESFVSLMEHQDLSALNLSEL